VQVSAQVDVGIFTSPRLSDCVSDWVPLGSRVCILKLKVENQSICMLQVYTTNAASKYQAFVDEVNDALLRVSTSESTVLMGDFNARIGTDTETWKGVIGRHGVSGLNGRYLFQLCCSNVLRIMNTFFQHKDFQQVQTNYGAKIDDKFLHRVGSLFSDVLDVRVRRGFELSTDHHLVICSLRISKPVPSRKSRKLHPVWQQSSGNFQMNLRTSRRNGDYSEQRSFLQLLNAVGKSG